MNCTKTFKCLSRHVYLTIKKKNVNAHLPILLKCGTRLHWLSSYSCRPGSRVRHEGRKIWQFQTLWFKGKSTLGNTNAKAPNHDAKWPLLSTLCITLVDLNQMGFAPRRNMQLSWDIFSSQKMTDFTGGGCYWCLACKGQACYRISNMAQDSPTAKNHLVQMSTALRLRKPVPGTQQFQRWRPHHRRACGTASLWTTAWQQPDSVLNTKGKDIQRLRHGHCPQRVHSLTRENKPGK